MAKKKEPRADQPGIDGIGDEYNATVSRAAKHYCKMRDVRMAASVVEKAAKNKMIETMHEAGFQTYSHGDVDVCLESKEGVKVVIGGKKVEEEEADSDEE